MIKNIRESALEYHSQGKPGKVEVVPTKPYSTQRDLSLAYSNFGADTEGSPVMVHNVIDAIDAIVHDKIRK